MGCKGTYSLAVTTAPVQLAEVLHEESGDGDSAYAVMLDYLIFGTLRAATRDSTVAVALEGESILADCLPPDVSDRASTSAVDTFDLIGTDDDVG